MGGQGPRVLWEPRKGGMESTCSHQEKLGLEPKKFLVSLKTGRCWPVFWG